MLDHSKLDAIQKTVRSIEQNLTRAYNKLTVSFLIAYFVQFCEWCREQALAEFDGDIQFNMDDPEKPKLETSINWLRDAKTNKLPKGSELKWFRFLFPEIPESRDEYRTNSLYKTLTQTIHKNAEKLAGIEYHRAVSGEVAGKGADKGEGKQLPTHDGNNVALPTGISELEFIMQSPITQALLSTVASFEARQKKPTGTLITFAQSLQVPSSYIQVLREKEEEYIKRIKADIEAARAEKSSAA